MLSYAKPFLLFFFQAEDGIRDYKVTGVQTCALPISAAGGPTGRGARLGEIALARFENYADLMDAGGDAACGRRGASAGCGESARRCGEGEMYGVRHAGDGECAVVAGYANARGGDELADDESVGRGGLNRRVGRRGGASAGCRESGRASDVGELRAARYRDHRKRAVVTKIGR